MHLKAFSTNQTPSVMHPQILQHPSISHSAPDWSCCGKWTLVSSFTALMYNKKQMYLQFLLLHYILLTIYVSRILSSQWEWEKCSPQNKCFWSSIFRILHLWFGTVVKVILLQKTAVLLCVISLIQMSVKG